MVAEITTNSLDRISCDGVLVFCFEGKKDLEKTEQFDYLDKILKRQLTNITKLENFKGKQGSILKLYLQGMLAPKVFIIGLGKVQDFSLDVLRKAVVVFAKGDKKNLSSISMSVFHDKKIEKSLSSQDQAQAVMEGLILGGYKFTKYKKKEEKKEIETVIFSELDKNVQNEIKKGADNAEIICDAVRLARDLVNEQASVVNPTFLAKLAQDIAKDNPQIKCKIIDRDEAEKMGMEAFLGVARGSDTPPKFIHLEYSPSAGRLEGKKFAIVGKGITFDTGGVSLKPENSMTTMKCDMAGAATVLGLFSIISKIKPVYPVMGIIAATPNLVSGKSLVPGDVLRAMNGKTIEVLNTDAEGRVTMADSLSYAVKNGATHILDLATLTGACMVALGSDITALFGNNEEFKKEIKDAADKTGEKLWELPLEKDYKDLNKSEVADISNIPSTRWGGAITAALFLEEFVDKKPWIHLDIAGPAFADKAHDLGPKGGTGWGVRMIIEMLKSE